MKFQQKILSLSLIIAALSTYCKGAANMSMGGKNTAASTMAQTSQYIDADTGGTISLGKNMTLSVPAGALSQSTEISVSQITAPAAADGVNPLVAYEFGQHGLQFHRPALLKMCYSGDAVRQQGLNEDSIAIYHDDDSNYAGYGGTVDTVNHCVTAEIYHFSTYFAAAQSLLSVNTPPSITAASFQPSTPLVGIPLKIRTVVNDFNAVGRGQVANVWLQYCVGSGGACSLPQQFTKVAMLPDTTSTTTTNRYTYTIPANKVSSSGITYFFEAIDNLRLPRISATKFQAITATPAAFQITPATFDIAAGFSRQLNVQVTASTGGSPMDIDFASVSVGNGIGSAALNNQGILVFDATTSGDPLTTGYRSGTVTATLGSLSANANVNVWPGKLTAIQILDTAGVVLGSNITLAPGASFDFDARGLDAFGNTSLVYPAWIVTNPLVGSIPNNDGVFTAGANDGQSGGVLAIVDNIAGSITVNIAAPPQVTLAGGSSFSENGGSTTITAFLSQTYASPVTISLAFTGTALPADYLVSSNTITIPAGQTSGDITLTGVDNALFEGNKSIIVDIASVLNGVEVGVQQVTATIIDDETAPYVIGATPTEGSSGNPVTSVITLTFSQAMNPATMTLSTSTACVGAIQISKAADNFSQCVAMTASLAAMNGSNTVATLTPAQPLAYNTTYKIRINATALGANGAALANPLTSPIGWTTEGVAAPDAFVIKAPMSISRSYLAMVQVNGKLYAIGGLDGATGGYLDLVEEYNPVTNSWATKTSMPTARAYLGAAVIGDKIYVIGGMNDVTRTTSLATVEMYDPATDAWVTKSSMPTARDKLMVASSSNGKIYAFGGIYGAPFGGEFLQTVEEYDPLNDLWTLKTNMPTSRGNAVAIPLTNGNILVCGGSNWNLGYVAIVEEYNPSTDSWTARSSMTTPRYGLSGALGANGRAYTFGGYGNPGSPSPITEEYDPITNSWAIRAAMSQARLGSAAAPGGNGDIYVVGGTFFPVTERYILP